MGIPRVIDLRVIKKRFGRAKHLSFFMSAGLWVLFFVACGSTPQPTATAMTPAATPSAAVPTSTMTPAQPNETMPAIGALTSFTIPLPTGWEGVKLSGVDITDALEQVHAVSPGLAQNVQTIISAAGPKSEILVAWTNSVSSTTTSQVQASLMAVAMQPNGMSLLRYVEDTGAALAQQANTTIQKQGVLYDLRTDGRPVGVVHYRMGDGDEGYQALLLNKEATEMLLLTLTAPPSPFAFFLPEFLKVVDEVD